MGELVDLKLHSETGVNLSSFLISSLLPFSYVALVNLFDHNGTDRNNPKSAKKRFVGAIFSNIVSIYLTHSYLKEFTTDPMKEMGFRLDSLGQAITYPFILMTSFYFGQFFMMHLDRTLWHYTDYYEWRRCLSCITWFRDVIFGPITEEIVFRCCSAVLMRHNIGNTAAIFIAPLPFALSHFHHVIDDQRKGQSLAHSLLLRAFQFCYTYVFGMFATYLQFSSGHALVPIIAHSICNAQGLPLVFEIGTYPKGSDRFLLWIAYFSGFAMFGYLLNTQYGMPLPNSVII